MNGPLEAEAGSWEAGAGRQEAGEIRMFNHWATGLRSELLPQVVVLQHQKLLPKRCHFERSFREGFDFWGQGKFFWRVLVGSWRSPASFLQGLAPPVVRWEVSYKGKSFQKKFEIWPNPKFRKMSQIGQGGPPRNPKNEKMSPKFGPWPLWGPAAGAEGLRITPDPLALAGLYVNIGLTCYTAIPVSLGGLGI